MLKKKLNEQQKQLATACLNGKSYSELCHLFGTTSIVIRSRLRRIYHSYDVNSRASFMALFCTIPASLEREKLDGLSQTLKNYKLTRKEIEVAYHIIVGFNTKDASEVLRIGEAGFRNHLCQVYKKVGVNDRESLKKLFNDKIRILPKPKEYYLHVDSQLLPRGCA